MAFHSCAMKSCTKKISSGRSNRCLPGADIDVHLNLTHDRDRALDDLLNGHVHKPLCILSISFFFNYVSRWSKRSEHDSKISKCPFDLGVKINLDPYCCTSCGTCTGTSTYLRRRKLNRCALFLKLISAQHSVQSLHIRGFSPSDSFTAQTCFHIVQMMISIFTSR